MTHEPESADSPILPPDFNLLRQQTMHPDPETRFVARRTYHGHWMGLAGPVRDESGVVDVCRALADSSPSNRWLAARALSRDPTAHGVRLALDLVRSEPDAWVRAELVRVLGRAGSEAADVLESLVGDSDERVRANALEVLVEIEHCPPVWELEAIATGPHHRARAAALVALARLTGVDVGSAVWELIVSEKPWLRASGPYVVRMLRPLWERSAL